MTIKPFKSQCAFISSTIIIVGPTDGASVEAVQDVAKCALCVVGCRQVVGSRCSC